MRSNQSAAVQEIKEKTLQSLNVAKEKIVETTKEAGRRVDQDARKRPWFYVGVAGFLSVVLGFLMGRKGRPNDRDKT